MKLRLTAVAVLALFAAAVSPAQTVKAGKSTGFFNIGDGAPRKHWYTDPKWWAGEGVIVASIWADGKTTAMRPAGITEANGLFLGTNPSDKKIAGISLLDFGIQTTLHAGAWHFTHHVPLADGSGYTQDRLGWRIVGYTGVPTSVALIAGRNAVKNYQLIQKYNK
jgi:hypothetical protein